MTHTPSQLAPSPASAPADAPADAPASIPAFDPSAKPALLSVAIVCKNNQDTIVRTLESVRELAHEIVAVDSGSTDDTIRILESFNARVIRSPWLGHVKTKQLALEACAGPWILSLDSDESLRPELQASIRGFLSERAGSSSILGVELNRRTFYRGQPLRFVWQPEWRLRLVRRGSAHWQGLDPHDQLQIKPGPGAGSVVRIAGDLRHDSFPTFAEHFRKQVQHASTMARSLHAAHHRGSVLRLLVSPPGAFFKQLILKRGFLDGYPGLLAAASAATAAIVKHAVLIELSRPPSPPPQPPPL